MFAPLIRATTPVLSSTARAAGPVIRAGVRDGVQALATVAVLYTAVAVVAVGSYGTYRGAVAAGRALARGTDATLTRIHTAFRRGPAQASDAVIDESGEAVQA